MKARKFLMLIVLMPAFCGLAHSQLVRFTSVYKIGYKDQGGSVVVPPAYDAGSDMKEGFAIVMKGYKRGYINASGQEAIPFKFDDASLFEHGLACVQQAGRYGYINTKGDWVVRPVYENAFSFKDGLARISINGKWGMINTQGTIVIPPTYMQLHDISKGLIAASLDGHHFGYINAEGKVIIDFRYSLAGPFNQHRRAIVTLSEKKYHINRKGRVLKSLNDGEETEELKERLERAEKN